MISWELWWEEVGVDVPRRHGKRSAPAGEKKTRAEEARSSASHDGLRGGAKEHDDDAERGAFPRDEHAAGHPVPDDVEGRHPHGRLIQRAVDQELELFREPGAELAEEEAPTAAVDEHGAASGRHGEKAEVEVNARGRDERGQRALLCGGGSSLLPTLKLGEARGRRGPWVGRRKQEDAAESTQEKS